MPPSKIDQSEQQKTSKYLIHNLVLESIFNLHPLKPITDLYLLSKKADIEILLKKIDYLGGENASCKRVSSNDYWIDIPKIAKFHVQNGNSIEIDPYSNIPIQSVLLYLFGSIMALCLYQRGLLVLHANAIEINNTAVLFAGDSGVGKSTTAAIFHKKGFNVLSDDIVVLNKQGQVMGGFPQIKLFKNSLDKLNISSQGLTPITAQKGKFSYPLAQSSQKKLTISAIYVLSISQVNNIKEFSFSPVRGAKRFEKLISNTYRNEFIEGLSLKSQHLELYSSLSRQIHMMNIVRPISHFSGYDLVDDIISDLRENSVLNN